MTNENEIISLQIDLLKEAVLILEDRIEKIELLARSKTYSSIIDSERDNSLVVFKIRSLRLYKDTLRYLTEELIREDEKISLFLMPHSRTLLDIYARFLHLQLNCKDKDEQALSCITYQLFSYRCLKSELQYNETLNLYKNFINSINFKYPEYSNFSNTWVGKNGKSFGKMKDILTQNNIKKYSINVCDIFSAETSYNIYSGFSEFLHGNPYYYSGIPHNERFWVISTSIVTTAFFIEMVDIHTLNKIKSKNFMAWLSQAKKNSSDFVRIWRSKKILFIK